MATSDRKASRKDQILQALAQMLEATPGGRITTAALAKEVGVSEAALYRHFPSKAKMFEGLIEFIENSLFSRINAIVKEEPDATEQCGQILHLLLAFTEKNPGITRILTGDAITGETDRLRQRVVQLYDRIETQLKQILREAELKQGKRTTLSPAQTANLMLCAAEGRISQYVRSGFTRSPLENWLGQWSLLSGALFRVPEKVI
ncbi:nucleoid occlusion factor SlmA [Ketobacter sp. MCCC 1A13808]|uniref:nucleoid occlusion factor SlmA n=1 Tax=Ketobacter sp. MCCC 1A13808 TaxID=2602738 RepID=UPI000F210261|nr:nucleoid occlusion factor SlmA [Ketobacter sp. MCCC 1A13808]MVF12100.1 nucleoid occlusion factor SlmA [Ketobacter sp. MCCC 1A13808]RLP52805.1 MAG: nucleoid occlusion factor SlmA [Ketobacter sp.]